MQREKTQLRGQTAEVGLGKTVKNARGRRRAPTGERARPPDDAKGRRIPIEGSEQRRRPPPPPLLTTTLALHFGRMHDP